MTANPLNTILQDAFDCLPNHVLIIDPLSMRFVGSNKTALDVLGYTNVELLQLTAEDIDATFSNEIIAAAFKNIIANNEQPPLFHTIHRRKDNSTFGVEVVLRCFRHINDTFILATCSKINVAVAPLHNLNLYSGLLNYVSEAIASTDRNFIVTSWNKSATELFGWTEEEAIGQHSRNLTAAIYPAQTQEELIDILFKTGVWKGEVIVHKKGGEAFPALVSIGALYDSEKNVTGYITVVNDITERKALENKLQDLNQQLSKKVTDKIKEITDVQQQLITIIDNIVDAVSLLKLEAPNNYRYVAVNDAYTKFSKLNKEDVIGKLVGELMPSESFDQLFKTFNKTIESKKVHSFESHHDWHGVFMTFEVTAVPILDKAGYADKLLVIAKDITEQKKAEQRLLKSEQRNRVLFDRTPVPIWMLDKNLNFLQVNHAAISEYGYTKEQFLKMNLKQIKLPEDHAYLNELSSMVHPPDYTGITRHILHNGEIIYSTVHSTTITFDDQDVILVASKNITSEVMAQKELIENEQQLSLIFDSTKDAMWLLKVEGENFRVETYNNAYSLTTGIEKDNAVGKLLEEVLPPESVDRIKHKYRHVVQTGETVSYFITMGFQKGEVTAEVTLTPIKDANNKVVRILGTGVDVTEKQKARRELIKTNLELRELASHLQNVREEERTHIAREIHDELGQQLTGLKMDLAWVNKKLYGKDESVTEKVKSALQLVDGTINTVRKIASELRPSIIDDLGIVEAIDWQSQQFMKRTGIAVEFNGEIKTASLPTGVPIAIFRIVQEALTNVSRHSKATKVVCTLKEEQDSVFLRIADNGTGFLLNNQERKTLGLLGMRERVAMLNGQYQIESEPGKGTEVSVRIPLN